MMGKSVPEVTIDLVAVFNRSLEILQQIKPLHVSSSEPNIYEDAEKALVAAIAGISKPFATQYIGDSIDDAA